MSISTMNLKDLQFLCEEKGLKFKGKTKAQLVTLINNNKAEEVDTIEDKNYSELSIKELREICTKSGLSRFGTKAELVKRLNEKENNKMDERRVIKWNDRGRKKATRPSESVGCDASSDDSSEDDDDSEIYKELKKDELKKKCLERNIPTSGTVKALIRRLKENDQMKEQVAKSRDKSSPEYQCESCDNNPNKLFSIPVAKWYCNDCEEHICNLCKEAHEKLRLTRTHVITPYGTILECNIDNDLTISVNDAIVVAPAPIVRPQFLDFTVSEDETSAVQQSGSKRKRVEDACEEEPSDFNNSYDVIYETR